MLFKIKNISMVIVLLLAFSISLNAEVSVKVKDLCYFDGMKENQLFGYGLVVGLQGTGDKNSPLLNSSLKNVLKTLGLDGDGLKTKNSAAVIITVKLPSVVRVGDKLDVTVSSIGDAKSLVGGVLIQSPLRGADGKIYLAAQGHLSVPKGSGKQIKTVAVVSNGGIIERGISQQIIKNNILSMVLKNWDYTTAYAIQKAVNEKYPNIKINIKENGKIDLDLKNSKNVSEIISDIENMEVEASTKAVVVINERDGTVVSGGDVKLSKAMVSRGTFKIEIEDSDSVSYASSIKDGSTIADFVDSMNAIGATTADIIAILKALKSSGALHAELVVR